jgi:hypothetical protein
VNKQLEMIFFVILLFCTFQKCVAHICYNGCSGHGYCDTAYNMCTCYSGWQGNDCSERTCPTGFPWSGDPTATDMLRSLEVECANAGKCDRATGLCVCDKAFTGFACERLKCNADCNGHGTCVSIGDAAVLKNDRNLMVATTYNLWDAHRVFGCVCDHGFSGYDCSLQDCPMGIDPLRPTTNEVNEVQTFKCHDGNDGAVSSGTFSMTFRGHTTKSMSYDITAANLETELETLPTITDVTVTYPNTDWCTASGTSRYARITFLREHGDLPDISVSGGPTISLSTTGSHATTDSVDGVGTPFPCNNRGLCDTAKGICSCNGNFYSSNGKLVMNSGGAGDCGFYSTTPSACGGSTSCSGHGTCNSTTFQCECHDGFQGYDCSQLSCPSGIAWWDEASAADTAHAMAICSNRGICDTGTGKCVCQAGFEGAVCERISCPLDSEFGKCAGAGNCYTTYERGQKRVVNGVLTPITYGTDPASVTTWDAHKIMSCVCDGDLNDHDEIYGRGGWDCSELKCPLGKGNFLGVDSQVNEVQTVTCPTATTGTFTLTFREQTTVSLAFDQIVSGTLYTFSGVTVTVTFATNQVQTSTDQSSQLSSNDIIVLTNQAGTDSREFTVDSVSGSTITTTEYVGMASAATYTLKKKIISIESALEDLDNIRNVTVTAFSDSDGTTSVTKACGSSGSHYIHITFTEDFGDLPPLSASATDIGSIAITETTKGTKDNLECSGRGQCDRTTGLCMCFGMSTSGNGNGGVGTRADCSYENPYPPYEASE